MVGGQSDFTNLLKWVQEQSLAEQGLGTMPRASDGFCCCDDGSALQTGLQEHQGPSRCAAVDRSDQHDFFSAAKSQKDVR